MLYTNVKVVHGKTRSLLIDLQNSKFYKIPDLVTKILKEKKCESTLSEQERDVYREYHDFLADNDLVNPQYSDKHFPEIDFDFDLPSKISNAIFVLNEVTIDYFEDIIKQLGDLNTKSLIIFANLELALILEELKFVSNSYINSVDIYIKKANTPEIKEHFDRMMDFRFVRNVVYYDGQYKSGVVTTDGYRNLVNLSHEVDFVKSCGVVDVAYFTINIQSYTESVNHNSCLNRKVSIDSEGNIKNCPSMKDSYGNIKTKTLAEAIEEPSFKKYWNINKDKIHVCKDCEFRYICTDCRAYVEDPEEILSKPLKCGYNPYTGEWSEWSTNPLKQKAIDFYGMRDMVLEINNSNDE